MIWDTDRLMANPALLDSDVILPAGGKIGEAFAAQAGTRIKALIQFEQETMLERTIRCVRAVSQGRVVVIGDEEALSHPAAALADIRVPEGISGPENMMHGLQALGNPTEHVLVVTTDQPFLTPESLQRWAAQADASVDICVPLIRQTDFLAKYPGMPATFFDIKDGAWTAGGAFLLRSETLPRIKPDIDRLFEQRKSKLGMVRLLGAGFVVKWLSKRLTTTDVKGKVESLLNCKGQLVYECDPELAFDIDKQEEFEYARRVFGA